MAKAGFYWHFKDRNDLKQQMLDYWSEEFTGSFLRSPELSLGAPAERLNSIARVVAQHDLDRYEVAIREWAQHDELAAAAYCQVISNRLEVVRRIFAELGFEGPELELRSRVFVCFVSWEGSMFLDVSASKRRAIDEAMIALLTNT